MDMNLVNTVLRFLTPEALFIVCILTLLMMCLKLYQKPTKRRIIIIIMMPVLLWAIYNGLIVYEPSPLFDKFLYRIAVLVTNICLVLLVVSDE